MKKETTEILMKHRQRAGVRVATNFFLLVVLLLGISVSGQAQQVLLPNQEYSESHTELSVQTLAGPVRIQRTWTAGQWYFNPAWAHLRLLADPMGGVLAVERAGSLYERTGSQAGGANAATDTGRIYRFDSDNFIEKTASGWRWYDRLGSSILYTAGGAIQSYSNPHGAQVSFSRDTQGRLSGVRDPMGRLIYTIDYDGAGRISRVTDIGGASVQYRWGSAGQLEQVIDSRGQAWRYEYDVHNQIARRINPAGASIQVTYGSKPGDLPAVVGFAGLGSGSSGGGTDAPIASSSGATKTPAPRNARVASLQDESGARWDYRVDYNRSRQEYAISIRRPDGSNSLRKYNREGWATYYSLQDQVQFQRIVDSATQHRVIDERGNTTTIQYDGSQQPIRIVYPDGSLESFQYDAQGRQLRYTNALGVVTNWRYDERGNVLDVIEAAGLPEQRTHRYSYDQWGNALTYARGSADARQNDVRTERTAYDNWGNVSQWTDGAGQSWAYTHNSRGDVITETTPLGSIWKAAYDPKGAVQRTEDPLRRARQYQYNSLGRPIAFTDAMGNVWQLAHDSAGRLIQLTDPLNHVWKKEYDALGRNTSRTSPSSQQARSQYDPLGRKVSVTDPAGNTTRYEYGASGSPQAGLRTATIYPTFKETYRYDQRGRQTQIAEQLNEGTIRSYRYAWDAVGRHIGTTDPAGNATLYRYDSLGRLIETIDSLNQSTKQTWDAHDQVTAVIDAKGNTHRFTYDKAGRCIEERQPGGSAVLYQYDAEGQLTMRTDAGGNTVRYRYDSANKLTAQEKSLAGALTEERTNYQYNANGLLNSYEQLDSAGRRISAVNYQRDSLGRISQRAIRYGDAIAHTLGQSYDADGQLAGHIYPDGSQGRYSYVRGRLSQVQLPNASAITYQDYQWMQPSRIQYPGASTTQTFDALQRVSSIEVKGAANQILASRQYQYDFAGNIRLINSDLGATQYSYDAIQRLTQVQPDTKLRDLGLPEEQYTYDAVHNRTSSAHQLGSWTYNSDNQLTQYPRRKGAQSLATQVQYNTQGNTQTETDTEGRKTYGYNAAQRLTRYEHTPINGLATQATYQYDPFGRRISKTVAQGRASETTYYLYGDSGMLAELDEQGRMTKAYGWDPVTAQNGLWSTAPLWQAEVNPQSPSLAAPAAAYHYLHTDHLATPMLATDKSGTQSWKAISEAFGSARVDSASAITMNLRFPGQYFDEESGRHQNFHRDYEPQTGRYLQRDPIGLLGGINAFTCRIPDDHMAACETDPGAPGTTLS